MKKIDFRFKNFHFEINVSIFKACKKFFLFHYKPCISLLSPWILLDHEISKASVQRVYNF